MKQLILIRHAKSSWESPNQTDFERPLNQRGLKDAPMMAKQLFKKMQQADAVITSNANRAYSTAVYFHQAFTTSALQPPPLIVIPELYHASEQVLLYTVSNINPQLDTVLLVAHNPGITDFANTLTHVRLDNMPTCGIFAVAANCNDWQHFETAEKDFLFFDAPKHL